MPELSRKNSAHSPSRTAHRTPNSAAVLSPLLCLCISLPSVDTVGVSCPGTSGVGLMGFNAWVRRRVPEGATVRRDPGHVLPSRPGPGAGPASAGHDEGAPPVGGAPSWRCVRRWAR